MSRMTSGVASAPLSQVDTPLLAVALAQGSAVPASLADLDRASGAVVARAITSGDFKGKRDETTLLYPSGGKPERVLLVGLGKQGEVSRNTIRRAAAVAAKRARALGVKQLAFAVAPEARNGVSARDVGQAAVEGAAQGAWAFTELKASPDEPKPEVERVTLVCEQTEMKEVAVGQRVGDAIAAGHRLTRHLQMLPGNVCTPSYLAEQAKQLADRYGFTLTVLDRAKLEQEGMGALLAVAQGSDQEPRFIVLEHRAGGGDRHRDAHRRRGGRPRPGGDRRDGKRRGPPGRSARGRGARRRALLAAAAVGRVPRPAQVGHRRRQELGRAGRRVDRRRVVPARIRGGVSLGAPRHRRHRVHRRRGAAPGQRPDGGRRPALHRVHSQARGGVTRGLSSTAALLLVAVGAAAQVDSTARRDTLARDSTAPTPKDTTTRDTLPHYLPVFPQAIPAGPLPRGTRYTFNADSLIFSNVQTLSDLLAHIPGVYVARGGIYGAGEIVMYGGRGAAGLEIYWDGVPYLPLGRDSVVLDPARISLAPLERSEVIVLPASLRVHAF